MAGFILYLSRLQNSFKLSKKELPLRNDTYVNQFLSVGKCEFTTDLVHDLLLLAALQSERQMVNYVARITIIVRDPHITYKIGGAAKVIVRVIRHVVRNNKERKSDFSICLGKWPK